jgi:hypothetical protein
MAQRQLYIDVFTQHAEEVARVIRGGGSGGGSGVGEAAKSVKRERAINDKQ